jgi:predicted nucleic acid-binding Zn ribbon protein
MSIRRSAPRPLALAVEALAERVAPATPLARIQRAWPAAVGPYVAANATPLRERGGVLTVYCPESGWANDVALGALQYVAAINRELGEDAVREIKVTGRPV